MLSGRVPFRSRGKELTESLYRHTHLTPPLVPNLAIDIQRVVDRALAKDASDRFSTVGEIAKTLETAITRVLPRTLTSASEDFQIFSPTTNQVSISPFPFI